MKRYIIAITIFTIMFSFPVSALSFSDVTEDYLWASESINSLAEMGAINGYPDGTFQPAKNITRAESAKIITHLFGNSSEKYEYSDVSENDWYSYYVQNSGNYFIKEDEFFPDNAILRKEVAYSLYKALKLPISKEEYKFKDKTDDNYIEAVKSAFAADILRGYEDNTVKSENKITRAEFAVMIMRAVSYSLNNKEEITEDKKEETEDESFTARNYFFVVTDVYSAVNDNSVPVTKVCGYNNGKYEEFEISEEENYIDYNNLMYSTSKIGKNDVVYIFKDYFGKPKGILNVMSCENLNYTIPLNVYSYTSDISLIYGSVNRVAGGNKLEIKSVTPVLAEEVYRISDNVNVYLYEDEKITEGKLTKIKEATATTDGSGVFALVNDSIITDMIIIR